MLVFRGKLLIDSKMTLLSNVPSRLPGKRKVRPGRVFRRLCGLGVGVFLAASAATDFFCPAAHAQQADLVAYAQQTDPAAHTQQTEPAPPVVVQPGAPGKPSRRLPPSTTAKLPPRSQAEVEFMQGMIMHHAQAVEMTALIPSHTENKDLRRLGARISSSQSDEIKFMKRWLAIRGEPVQLPSGAMPGMRNVDISHHNMPLMPGMLTPEQMDALRKAKDGEFDHLFLTGMIQHHNGALTMVKDLFDTAGAGQDAEVFDFATDADNTQRAEIKVMQSMLEKKIPEEKQ
jgi:uncharacterized protein (DUF305 family)